MGRIKVALATMFLLQSSTGSCPSSSTGSGNRVTDFATGFTNITGFESGTVCVDICAPPGSVVVPEGKNATFDWDYVVMDHIYTPQLCHALSQEGGEHDPTLTNLPGAKCHGRPGAPLMAIHGLWPNYNPEVPGYAACCGSPSPLDSTVTATWRPETFSAMRSKWIDVAVEDGCDSCFTWNHEWQKHGMCFTDSPEKYFEAGLALHDAAEEGIQKVGTFLQAHAGGTVTVEEVQALYSEATGSSAKLNVVCDLQSSTQIDGVDVPYVSEFTTCWARKAGVFKGVPVTALDLDPIECPSALKGARSGPCDTVFAVISSGAITV